MNDAARVRSGERIGDSARELERFTDGHGPACEPAMQVLAFEPLHREKEGRLLAVRDVADDARMRELGERPCFAFEASDVRFRALADELHRHELAGVAIARAVHLAHATAARERLDLESAADDGTGWNRLLDGHGSESGGIIREQRRSRRNRQATTG